jgi:hypothetical protein
MEKLKLAPLVQNPTDTAQRERATCDKYGIPEGTDIMQLRNPRSNRYVKVSRKRGLFFLLKRA